MIKCPACCSQQIREGGSYRAHHASFGGLRRLICDTCGLNFADPMPSEAALHEYNASYFDNAHGGAAARPEERAFFTGVAALRIAHIQNYTRAKGTAVSSVLEVGPGAGDFAKHWIAQKPDTRYFGIETDTTCHAALSEAGVELLAPGCLVPEIDLLVFSHVLEHVTNPLSFLSPFIEKLRPGGAIFVEVPCNDWQHKEVNEPHLLFFDKKPMGSLLESLGLSSIQLSYHGRRIAELQRNDVISTQWKRVRSRLLRMGLVAPFGGMCPGMEALSGDLERAVIAPTQAHVEHQEPSWWLRAMASKPPL